MRAPCGWRCAGDAFALLNLDKPDDVSTPAQTRPSTDPHPIHTNVLARQHRPLTHTHVAGEHLDPVPRERTPPHVPKRLLYDQHRLPAIPAIHTVENRLQSRTGNLSRHHPRPVKPHQHITHRRTCSHNSRSHSVPPHLTYRPRSTEHSLPSRSVDQHSAQSCTNSCPCAAPLISVLRSPREPTDRQTVQSERGSRIVQRSSQRDSPGTSRRCSMWSTVDRRALDRRKAPTSYAPAGSTMPALGLVRSAAADDLRVIPRLRPRRRVRPKRSWAGHAQAVRSEHVSRRRRGHRAELPTRPRRPPVDR